MKILLQRVKEASVKIDNKIHSQIKNGLLIFIGIEKGDTNEIADKLALKISKLRVFEDDKGKMNYSITDTKGEILVVSQFTLCGDCSKGTRPSFDKSEAPQLANKLYEYFTNKLRDYNIPCKTGKFGAMMDISLINNGPVTFILEK